MLTGLATATAAPVQVGTIWRRSMRTPVAEDASRTTMPLSRKVIQARLRPSLPGPRYGWSVNAQNSRTLPTTMPHRATATTVAAVRDAHAWSRDASTTRSASGAATRKASASPVSRLLAGQVGGSWSDFNGFAVSGKIVDASWSLRAGLDRLIPVGRGGTLFAGIGLEYGESRSWLDNLTISQQGPHNYNFGGSARIGVSSPFVARFQVYGEVLESFYRAHARDGTSGNQYNWLGRSLTGAFGVRFAAVSARLRQ